MATSLKPPSEVAVKDDDGDLVKLVNRRLSDVQKLVTHVKKLEGELAKARVELDEAVTVLDLVRAKKLGAENRNPVSRREGTSLNGRDGQFSGEDHPASHSPVKKPVAPAASPSAHSKKTTLAARTKSPAKSPAKDRRQEKSSKRSSGAGMEGKSKKFKGAVQREHVDLISSIRSQSKPKKLDVAMPSYVPLQHKRKPRSLVLSPAIDHLCATSALDGVVNFWQISQEKGFGVNLSHTVDCISPVQRRWPEDLAWHPLGEMLFAVYTADGGPQIAIINTSKKKPGVKFLDDKPHEKGIINTIQFLPWSNGSQFVTGGCDHGVVLWTEKDKGWQPQLLHRTLHSSSVTGVGGILSKNYIISSGMDKRVFAVDPSHGRSTFHHQLESKALAVAPNPTDNNLVMVQTGTPGQQLRLFDIRVQRTELHCFGWKQQAGDSQSGYISQSWSPDGLYCASGSTDPKIHVFDIRYNSREPAQTLDAHQKRVFKAAWHPNLPLLLSISSDLFIGMHKIFP